MLAKALSRASGLELSMAQQLVGEWRAGFGQVSLVAGLAADLADISSQSALTTSVCSICKMRWSSARSTSPPQRTLTDPRKYDDQSYYERVVAMR